MLPLYAKFVLHFKHITVSDLQQAFAWTYILNLFLEKTKQRILKQGLVLHANIWLIEMFWSGFFLPVFNLFVCMLDVFIDCPITKASHNNSHDQNKEKSKIQQSNPSVIKWSRPLKQYYKRWERSWMKQRAKFYDIQKS